MIRALALAIGCAAFLAPAAVRADDQCVLEGAFDGAEIRVREARGIRLVRVPDGERVALTPVRTGLSEVRTLGTSALVGTTRDTPRIALSRAIAIGNGTVELPAGLLVDTLHAMPGAWARIDVSIGDGIAIRLVDVPCDALALVGADVASPAETAVRTAAEGPRWRPRTARVSIFDRDDHEGAIRLLVAPESAARFVELERRRGGWVRVAMDTSRGARIRGWMREADLD